MYPHAQSRKIRSESRIHKYRGSRSPLRTLEVLGSPIREVAIYAPPRLIPRHTAHRSSRQILEGHVRQYVQWFHRILKLNDRERTRSAEWLRHDFRNLNRNAGWRMQRNSGGSLFHSIWTIRGEATVRDVYIRRFGLHQLPLVRFPNLSG